MTPNHALHPVLDALPTRPTVEVSALDRILDHPAALGEELSDLLCELAARPLTGLESGGGPQSLALSDARESRPFEPIFAPARQLTFDDEIRIAKRIEFTRLRLAFTLASAELSDETRQRYQTLTGVDLSRFVTAWPAGVSLPGAGTVHARWREWLACRNELIENNIALVERIAMRYRTYGIPHGDLVQHGNLGLIRAADKYDWRHNVRFRTYAEWWIRQSIERATDTDRDVIHVPRPMRQKLSKANRLNRKAGGAKLDAEKFAELMGIDREAAAHAFSIKSGVLSLDRVADEDGRPMRNDIVGPDLARREEIEVHEHLRARLEGLLGELPNREKQVLAMRFGLDGAEPRTLEEVGGVLGISRERVRQLQARALDQLRDSVPDPRDPFGA